MSRAAFLLSAAWASVRCLGRFNGILIPLLSEEWNLTPGQAAWIGTPTCRACLGACMGDHRRPDRSQSRIFGDHRRVRFHDRRSLCAQPGGLCHPAISSRLWIRWSDPGRLCPGGEFTRKHRGRVLTAMDAWWPVGAALAGFVSAWFMTIWATGVRPYWSWSYRQYVNLCAPVDPRIAHVSIRTNQHDKAVRSSMDSSGHRCPTRGLPTRHDARHSQMSAGAVIDQRTRLVVSWRTTLAIAAIFDRHVRYYVSRSGCQPSSWTPVLPKLRHF